MPYCARCGTQVAEISYAPCPSCGNPTNGAPRPNVKSGTSAGVVVAIVVGVALVGIAFIGIIAAIAIPNLIHATQRSKQARTMADIRAIASAVEAYAQDNKEYPDPDRLEEKLVPTYIRTLPDQDGWENAFVYECWSAVEGTPCDSYAIASPGKDGVLDHDSVDAYEGVGATTNFDNDIVLIDGSFVQYPKGRGSE